MISFFPSRYANEASAWSPSLPLKKAQTQSKTKNPVHSSTTGSAGKEVSTQAVSFDRRAGRIFGPAEADRNPSQNLVPEPPGKDEEVARI